MDTQNSARSISTVHYAWLDIRTSDLSSEADFKYVTVSWFSMRAYMFISLLVLEYLG
jgi:hypothetical protein